MESEKLEFKLTLDPDFKLNPEQLQDLLFEIANGIQYVKPEPPKQQDFHPIYGVMVGKCTIDAMTCRQSFIPDHFHENCLFSARRKVIADICKEHNKDLKRCDRGYVIDLEDYWEPKEIHLIL